MPLPMPPSTPSNASNNFLDRLFPRRARRGRLVKSASGGGGNWTSPGGGGGGGGGAAVASRAATASAPAEPAPTRSLPAPAARPGSAPQGAKRGSRPAGSPPRSSSSSSSRDKGAWRTGVALAGAFAAGAAAAVAAGKATPTTAVATPAKAAKAAAAAAAAPPPPPPKPGKETAPLRALPRSIPPRGHEDHTFVRRGLLRAVLAGGPGWDLVERRVSADALPLPPPDRDGRAGRVRGRLPAAVAAAGGWTAHQAADKVRRAVAEAGDRLAGDSVSRVGSAVRKPLGAAGRAVVGVLPKGVRRQAKGAVHGM